MLALVLFLLYLGVNLTTLQVAAAAQQQQSRFLNSTAVTLSEAIKGAISVLMIWAARGSGSTRDGQAKGR